MSEIRKQIGEQFDIAVNFTPKMPANSALVSGILMATRMGKTDITALTNVVQADAISIVLDNDVHAGAMLLLNPGRDNEEPLLVIRTVGSGPYTAVLASNAQLDHEAGEQVKYDVGASDLVLANTNATIVSPYMKANILGGVIYHYIIVFLATLTTGEIIREDVDLLMHD